MAIRAIKNPPVEQDEFDIIGLTREEAVILATLTSYIGGNPNGPRGFIEKLRNALIEKGIHSYEFTGWIAGSIQIENGTPERRLV